MEENKGFFSKLRRDAAALSRVRVLCLCAMLAAMSVVLAYLAKVVFGLGPIRITLENFPIIFGGVSFGPFAGAMIAAVADLCSCLMSGQAPNPLIFIGSLLVGLTAGFLGRYVFKKKKWLSLFAVELLAQMVGSVLVKSLALHLYFGYHPLLLLPRLPLYLGIALGESYLLFSIYKNKNLTALLERMYRA